MSLFEGKTVDEVSQSLEQRTFEEGKKLLTDYFVDSAYMTRSYKKDGAVDETIGAIVFWDYDSMYKYFKVVPTPNDFRDWWDEKVENDPDGGELQQKMLPLKYWGLEMRESAGSLDPIGWNGLDWIETGQGVQTYKDCRYELHFKYKPIVPIYIKSDIRLNINLDYNSMGPTITQYDYFE